MRQWSFFLILLCALSSTSIAGDTITPTTSITDGQTLVSAGGTFELGFFNPDSPRNRYLGIWYQKIPIQTVVWVANRANPITDSTGVLKISSDGSLTLLNGSSIVFWSAGSANASNPVAQLLDSGNFVLRQSSDPESFAWQSFDYPTDTLLSGMKLGWNLKTGLDRYLTAWKTSNDPSPGDYSFKMDPHGSPELFLYRGSTRIYASGPWNGLQFSGVPELKSDDMFTFSFISNQDEVYYTYEITNQSVVSRLLLNESGALQRHVWLGTRIGWSVFWSDPKDVCDNFAECGPFGVCNSNDSPVCSCLHGFEPKSPQDWNLRDGSDGCVRMTRLDCERDGFLMMPHMKLPESTNATVNTSMTLDECRGMCLKYCSCMAYASANITGGGSGCIIWTSDLIDLREFEDGGQDLYIRLAASELGGVNTKKSDKNQLVIIVVSILAMLLLLGLGGYCIWIKKAKQRGKMASLPSRGERDLVVFLAKNYSVLGSAKDHCLDNDRNGRKDLELPIFDMGTIMVATENFTDANKLGEGGFGPVYKGKLGHGQDIAVKRLSKNSLQGLDEFKNEVILIAKLQHRNLVRLLGCCIYGEERMLIYEFMHNLSLDTFIFDETKCRILNWQRRFAIILGIARGLLYLHQDSRFRIIHRDLKASNVLLDRDLNPKISDFGMARIFGGNQTDAYTQRVVGTYGYMSPEYAMDGIFSMKSDVFSFGVLVLEVVSGKRNRGFYQSETHLNLLSYAWRLWKEGKSLELVDESMGSSYTISEVLRCIQVGLLCVQERAGDRPIMSSVTMMLGSESVNVPEPSEPGFISAKNTIDTESSSCCTVNEVTVTVVDAR